MSHFTVLVIGENPEEQLAPYQENNSNNFSQQYSTFYNVEEEGRKEYENGEINVDEIYYNSIQISEKDYKNIINNENATIHIHDPLDIIDINLDRYVLYRFVSSSNYENRLIGKITTVDKISNNHIILTVKRFPNIRKIKIKDKMTWDEYMSHYCGYKYDEVEEAYGYWANDNARWDYNQLGGRWSGFFQLKPAEKIPESVSCILFQLIDDINISETEMATIIHFYRNDYKKFENIISKYGEKSIEIKKFIENLPEYITEDDVAFSYRKGILGSNGVFGSNKNSLVGKADQARKRDIDFYAMIQQSKERAKNEYELFERFYGGSIPRLEYTWDYISKSKNFSKMSIQEKKIFYANQKPIAKKFNIDNNLYPTFSEYELDFITYNDFENFICSKDEYVEKAAAKALSTFAVVKDGEWYQKSEMGWFGFALNEKDKDDWNKIVLHLIEEAGDDDLFSLYDCHI